MTVDEDVSERRRDRFTVGLFGQFDSLLHDYLTSYSTIRRQDSEGFSIKSIISRLDGIVLRSPFKLEDDLVRLAGRLKWIVRAGSGTDNISPLFAERGVLLRTTPINAYSVAELVLALVLGLLRNVRAGHESLRQGLWSKHALVGRELRGKTVGILGFGRIGREVSCLMQHFGTSIVVHDRTPAADQKRVTAQLVGARFVTQDALLGQADILICCLPGTPETLGFFDASRLRSLKPGALLINVGRGSLLDLDALAGALRSGRLGGAALDVFRPEPPGALDLFGMSNVLCTPHLGAQTLETHGAIAAGVIAHLADLLPSRDLPLDAARS